MTPTRFPSPRPSAGLVARALGFWLALAVLAWPALAQVMAKHPRVAELEDKLGQDALAYLKARFPNLPVLVAVSIDPLRRDAALDRASRGPDDGGADLPLFPGTNEFEIRDEWDDPARSLHELFPRIRTAAVKVTLPATVSDQEIVELREGLYLVLHLVPGRDRMDFERKPWNQPSDGRLLELAGQALLGVLLVSLLFFGLRSASVRIAGALQGASPAAPAATPMATPAAPALPSQLPPLPGTRGGGEVKFNDPIKIRESLQAMIGQLHGEAVFPTLKDMTLFDGIAAETPALLRAFVGELPLESRQALFRYGQGKAWLDAFAEPGDLTMECFELFVRLGKTRAKDADRAWEDLLIALWRTGPVLPEILKSVPQEAAFAVLQDMPSDIAVPMGKQAFPGSWGILLQNAKRLPRPDAAARAKLLDAATKASPWLDWEDVERYRHEKGLLAYLRTASCEQEREIYEASEPGSSIHKLRPPFYRLFTESDEHLKALVRKYAIADWAMALFNVNRPDRRKVEDFLSEKQRFMLIEQLRHLDKNPPDRQAVGLLREAMGRELQTLRAGLAAARDQSESEGSDAEVATLATRRGAKKARGGKSHDDAA